MNTGLRIFCAAVFTDSGLAPSARPGMTLEVMNRISYDLSFAEQDETFPVVDLDNRNGTTAAGEKRDA
jgi:hypothetical protein